MNKILEILKDIKPECDFENSKDYISDGFLDSFDIVTLVSEIEERFDVLIDALDILPENFMTAQTIADVVAKNGGKIE